MTDEDYREYIDYLRCCCYNPNEYADVKKGKQMLISGELKSKKELKEWYEKENKRLEPIRKDNEIAFHGSDEEVVELAKRICPERLGSISLSLIS